jgi:hypothetical protein
MDKFTLCYSPIVTSENRFEGLHLAIESTDAESLELRAALSELRHFIGSVPGTVLLSHSQVNEHPVDEMHFPPNAVLVTPASGLVEEKIRDLFRRANLSRGTRLAVQGRSDTPLPRDMIPMFDFALIGEHEDRRRKQDTNAPTAYRRIPYITIGDTTQEGVESAFFAGAIAAIGWPKTPGDLPSLARPSQPPQIAAVRFLAMASKGASLEELQSALSLAPAIEGRLMKLAPALADDRSKPSTFAQIFATEGHPGLIRLFSVLLITSSRDYKALALVYASLVRALFLANTADPETRHDIFVAALLSLAPRITSTKLDDLLDLAHISPAIRALSMNPGQEHTRRMALAEALEDGDVRGVQMHLAALDVAQSDANRALLSALASANTVMKIFQPD